MAMVTSWEPSALSFRRMTLYDVDRVLDVEKRCFSAPWSRQAFVTELVQNQFAHYLVAEYEGRIIGYSGVWLIIDEGHITNIAVDPDFRGLKLGEILLRTMATHCLANGGQRMTLEVRVSNTVAQTLYTKLGFSEAGTRKGYYTDNNEDAIIMWADLPLPS